MRVSRYLPVVKRYLRIVIVKPGINTVHLPCLACANKGRPGLHEVMVTGEITHAEIHGLTIIIRRANVTAYN